RAADDGPHPVRAEDAFGDLRVAPGIEDRLHHRFRASSWSAALIRASSPPSVPATAPAAFRASAVEYPSDSSAATTSESAAAALAAMPAACTFSFGSRMMRWAVLRPTPETLVNTSAWSVTIASWGFVTGWAEVIASATRG